MTIRFNPLPSGRLWRRQRKIQNPDRPPFSSSATDCNVLLGVIQIHSLDARLYSQNLGLERASQVHLNHRQQADPLLRFAVGVDDRLLNELIQPALGELLNELIQPALGEPPTG